MKNVAILMATYNGEKFVEQQINSILSQDNVYIQLFISDDCSTDNTIGVVEKLQKNHNCIHIVSRTEKFGSAAPNFFSLVKNVDVATFDFVAFSDQDDIWQSDKLDFAIMEMERNACNGFSSSITAYWPGSGEKKLIDKASPQTSEDCWFQSPGPGCSQVFTGQSFLSFQKFVSENYQELNKVDYHDWLVYAFYRHHNLGWYISPEPKMLYVQHEANQIGANSGISSLTRRLKMIKENWLRKQVNLTYKLVTGNNQDLINFKYMTKNLTSLRRKKVHSIALYILYIVGIL